MLNKKILIGSLLASLISTAAPAGEMLITSEKFLPGIDPQQIIARDNLTQTVVLHASPQNETILSGNAHAAGRCGGFEKVFAASEPSTLVSEVAVAKSLLAQLQVMQQMPRSVRMVTPEAIQAATQAAELVVAKNIEEHVRWYSSFHTRFHRSAKANEAVQALRSRIVSVIGPAPHASVTSITHQSTPQQSLQIRFAGTNPAAEPVVIGGHLDSISGWGFGEPHAPGADDNASGVGALLEAARILSQQPPSEQDIYVFFYAGEEGGLLGSAEIAQNFKRRAQPVRGILQLDMTMFPGDGPLTIASMTDFTSPQLRAWLKTFNEAALGVKVLDDECGYGCSDHASWHRQGYATLMPFESSFDRMNRNIHTARDVVDAGSSFEHAAIFAKIAVGFALSAP